MPLLSEDIRKEIYSSVFIHDDFLNKINRGLNIDITQDKNNLDYETSPYALYFFTAPDCQNILNDSALTYINELTSIPLQLRNFLVYSQASPRNLFIPILTNTVELSGASPADYSSATRDLAENRLGVRQTLMGNIVQNMIGQDVSFSFREVSSKYLGQNIVTQLLKAWMIYANAVTFGRVNPGPNYTFTDGMRKGTATVIANIRRQINYASSIYYFKLQPNGKTISYYGKWTGVFPKNVGTSSISGDSKEALKIPVSFQTQYYEDLDSDILNEFNILARNDGNNFKIVQQGNNFELLFAEEETFGAATPYVAPPTRMPSTQGIG
jgi:hypothetical protein